MRHTKIVVLCFALLALLTAITPFKKEVRAQVSSGTNPLSGYAWSSTIGWISFSSAGTGSAVDYGVSMNTASGELSGYAWADPRDDAGLGSLAALSTNTVLASIGKILSPRLAEAQTTSEQWLAFTYPGFGNSYIYLSKLPADSVTHEGKTLFIFDLDKIYFGGLTAFTADPETAIKNTALVPVGYTRIPDTRYLFNTAQLAAEPAGTRAGLIDGFASFIPNRFLCTENKVNAPECHVNNLGTWAPGIGYAPTAQVHVSFSDNDSGVVFSPAEVLGTFTVTTSTGSGLQNPGDTSTPTPTPVSAPLSPVATSNIGWITFNKSELAGCPDGNCIAEITGGRLKGWARACTVFVSGCSGAEKPDSQLGGWDGWISLSGTATDGSTYGPVVNQSKNGLLEGFAWGSSVVGWIGFDVLATLPPSGGGGSGGTVGGGSPGGCPGVCVNGAVAADLSAEIRANGTLGSLAVTTAQPVTISWSSDGPSNRTCRVRSFDVVTSSPGSVIASTQAGSQSLGTLAVGSYGYRITCEILDLSLGAAVIAQSTSPQSVTSSVVVTVTKAQKDPSSCELPNGIVLANGETRAFYKNSTRATKALCEELGVNKLEYTCTNGVLGGDPFDATFTKASCRAGTIIEQ